MRELNSQASSAINEQLRRDSGEEVSMRASTYDCLPNKALLDDSNYFRVTFGGRVTLNSHYESINSTPTFGHVVLPAPGQMAFLRLTQSDSPRWPQAIPWAKQTGAIRVNIKESIAYF
ncbi:MAG TPA: hypothetical protein VGG45_00115 [Terracidiphilus sp.]|jgi:hypothetical protein